jgi:hypothetical protein
VTIAFAFVGAVDKPGCMTIHPFFDSAQSILQRQAAQLQAAIEEALSADQCATAIAHSLNSTVEEIVMGQFGK